MIILLIITIVFIFLSYKFYKNYKVPKIGSLAIVTGGVKCGKSTFAVMLAIKQYKRNLRRVKIRNFLARLFGKKEEELPLLYSNIPLSVEYVPLTKELMQRKKRFRYKSVIYINEASLLADSKAIKNEEINLKMLLTFKLIGHETKGGCIILDTHTVADCHYSIKRCTSEYFYIHHLTKWIPFFLCAKIQEIKFSDDGSTIFAQNEDIEEHLKMVVFRKKYWKYFDTYAFSSNTDKLEIEDKTVKADRLKVEDLITFNDNLKVIYDNEKKGGVSIEKKNN